MRLELPLGEMELDEGEGEGGGWRLGEVELGEEGMWVEVVQEGREE
jgi:hypothetical protein